MKTIFVILMLALGALAQTPQPTPPQINVPPGWQLVPQKDIDACASVAQQLIAAKDALMKAANERVMTDKERATVQAVYAAYDKLIAVQEGMITDLKDIKTMFKEVVEMQQKILLDLTARLNKPKSSWDKFLDALKTAVTLAGGILLGSHL
jgi:hypothetical protein